MQNKQFHEKSRLQQTTIVFIFIPKKPDLYMYTHINRYSR